MNLHLYDLYGAWVATCYGWGDLARYVAARWPYRGEVVDDAGRVVGTVERGVVRRAR